MFLDFLFIVPYYIDYFLLEFLIEYLHFTFKLVKLSIVNLMCGNSLVKFFCISIAMISGLQAVFLAADTTFGVKLDVFSSWVFHLIWNKIILEFIL